MVCARAPVAGGLRLLADGCTLFLARRGPIEALQSQGETRQLQIYIYIYIYIYTHMIISLSLYIYIYYYI